MSKKEGIFKVRIKELRQKRNHPQPWRRKHKKSSKIKIR